MSHMPDYEEGGSACAASSSCSAPRIVTYTATGSEGTDFTVSIGATLSLDTYNVGFFGAAGAAVIPMFDFPNALAGDRTTTTFRVLSSSVLTAADIFKFQIIEA